MDTYFPRLIKEHIMKRKKFNLKKEVVDLSFLLPAFLVFLFMILLPLLNGNTLYVYRLGWYFSNTKFCWL